MAPRIDPETKFFRKVKWTDDPLGCWLWESEIDRDGYGQFTVGTYDGKRVRAKAHRWAYEFLRAEIPKGLTIDHLCKVRNCVNPWHMEPVTFGENARRGTRIYRRRTHCGQGHDQSIHGITYVSAGRTRRRCQTCFNTKRRARRAARKALAA
ncbi:MAG TPA: HNH endonuclease [Acidimicrobiales bacterium]|nr:HNH endonuclease [Acidimicrobiales bacterium]